MTGKTSVTLVTGGTASAREAAIAAMIDNCAANKFDIANAIGIILEGMPDGIESFAALAGHFPSVMIARIAPGCPCCLGNLTMRVTLNRMLQRSPKNLYISLATSTHLDQVRRFFMQPPYNKLIELAKDLSI